MNACNIVSKLLFLMNDSLKDFLKKSQKIKNQNISYKLKHY